MLLCRLCKAAVQPGAGIESHFRQEHQLKGIVLKDIKNYYGSMELADPKFAASSEDNSLAIELLTISDGFSCPTCRYLIVAQDNTVRHWREAGYGDAEVRWAKVKLQTWMRGRKNARYWTIRDCNNVNDTSTGTTRQSAMESHRRQPSPTKSRRFHATSEG